MIASDIVEYSHKFLWGAYFRTGITVYGSDVSNAGFGFGIVMMSEVPGQEIIDTMHSGYGNVKGIVQRFGRQGFLLEKRFGQRHYGLCDWQDGKT